MLNVKSKLNILKLALKELNTPDDFKCNFYGGLTNQISHIALGAIVSGFLICVWNFIYGEMPYKEIYIFVVCALYLLNIEIVAQKSFSIDCFIDTYFVSLGVCFLIYPFSEKYHPEIGFYLVVNANAVFLLFFISIISLFAYSWKRMRVQYEHFR